jgi:hypothetical protein
LRQILKYIILYFSFSSPGARVAQWVRSLDLTTHTSLSPIRHGFAPSFVNYKKGCTRLAAASDKVYQLLAHGQWFSPGTPASSTTKTGSLDIAEILLKNPKKNKNQSISPVLYFETDIKIHNFTFSLSPVLHLYIFRQILKYIILHFSLVSFIFWDRYWNTVFYISLSNFSFNR